MKNGNVWQDPSKYSNTIENNDLILIMTPEKQDKTVELSKHWSADSTPARNEVIMKTTYIQCLISTEFLLNSL